MNIDTNIYTSLKSVLTSSNQFQNVFEMFRNNNSTRLRELKAYITTEDQKQTALTLHGIKGSCRMFGEVDCAKTCERLESKLHTLKSFPSNSDLDELRLKLQIFTNFLESEATAKTMPNSVALNTDRYH
jgi:HPt (histidine-containing phosphotransfer) domain-containing protein